MSQSDQTTLKAADVPIVPPENGLPVRLYDPLSGQLCIGAGRFGLRMNFGADFRPGPAVSGLSQSWIHPDTYENKGLLAALDCFFGQCLSLKNLTLESADVPIVPPQMAFPSGCTTQRLACVTSALAAGLRMNFGTDFRLGDRPSQVCHSSRFI